VLHLLIELMGKDLPDSKQNEKKKEAHYYYRLGHAAYYGGLYPNARKNLFLSLKLNPLDLKTWTFFLASCFKT